MAVSLKVPDRLPSETAQEWHSRFANVNGFALHELVSRTPNRIVVVNLDAQARSAKVAIRTPLNLEALVPAGVAASIDPDKALILSYEDGRMVSTQVEIILNEE